VKVGVPEAEAALRLEAIEPTLGRLRPEPLAGGAWLLCDDFKSALETVDAALDLFAEIPASRKQIVFGEISEPPTPQGPVYSRIGQRMGSIADRVILACGVKSFRRLRAGAQSARGSCEVLHAGPSSREAARLLALDLRPGDVVLIKGRDTQKLARVALRLRGLEVGCDIPVCDEKNLCAVCPLRVCGPAVQKGL
jgi:UDP-N-acetylmuramoyl-tripeptide--D-alanyl-D-alanine ligase